MILEGKKKVRVEQRKMLKIGDKKYKNRSEMTWSIYFVVSVNIKSFVFRERLFQIVVDGNVKDHE